MIKEKKNYYPKQSRVPITKEQRDALENVEGFFVKDIMDYYRLSYPKALKLFKKIKEIYGTTPFDDRQLKRTDVFNYIQKKEKNKEMCL